MWRKSSKMVDNSNRFAGKFKLKSSRLKNWDYSTPGFYLITICTYNHNNFFGKIIDNKMELSKIGEIVRSELFKTFEIRKNIKLNEWVIMPNHIHILMEIKYQIDNNVETHCVRLYNEKINLSIFQTQNTNNNQTQNIDNNTRDAYNASLQKINIKSNQIIPKVMKLFKASVKSKCNHQNIWFSWQSRFHDEIIKDEKELLIIKQYIQNNVKNWQKDKFFNLIKVKN